MGLGSAEFLGTRSWLPPPSAAGKRLMGQGSSLLLMTLGCDTRDCWVTMPETIATKAKVWQAGKLSGPSHQNITYLIYITEFFGAPWNFVHKASAFRTSPQPSPGPPVTSQIEFCSQLSFEMKAWCSEKIQLSEISNELPRFPRDR